MKLINRWQSGLVTPLVMLAGAFVLMLGVAANQYWQVKQQAPIAAKNTGEKCQNITDQTACRDACYGGYDCKWNNQTKQCYKSDNKCGQVPPDDNRRCSPGAVPGEHPAANALISYCPGKKSFGCTADIWPNGDFNPPGIKWNTYNFSIVGNYCGAIQVDEGGQWCNFLETECNPQPKPSPSASPKPSPSASPQPSPKPSPKPPAWFVIRKFHDKDHDGIWDPSEGATWRNWHFQYRVNNGSWKDYWVFAWSTKGPRITVKAGSSVEVRELNVGGWTNTTGLTQSKDIRRLGVTYFNFGNYKEKPEATPSPEPSPTPSPLPSPEPGQAAFVIRKFNDTDKDGTWDANETSTGLDWYFDYRLNDGDWQEYRAAADSGWGGVISVEKNTKVEAKERTVDGWTNSTGLTQIRILENEQVYYFDFGNFQPPQAEAVEPPAEAPRAGAGSRWWPWLVLGGLGIGLQLLAIIL